MPMSAAICLAAVIYGSVPQIMMQDRDRTYWIQFQHESTLLPKVSMLHCDPLVRSEGRDFTHKREDLSRVELSQLTEQFPQAEVVYL